MVGFLIAALLVSAPATVPVAMMVPPQANPAMWVVQDEDTTVYLFGTFHALDGRTHWFNNDVRAAFSSADELVLETVIPDRLRFGSAAPRYRPRALTRSLSVAPGASFVATTRLAISAGRDRGMDVAKGADMVLRRAAEDEGKTVEGLESVAFQLGMVDRMAPAQPPASAPLANPDARARLTALLVHMQAAWNRGDQRIFTALLDEMRLSTPGNYRKMFPERNAQWADWIVNRMDRPGTVFVAVGAGHFAGPDSVLSKLTLKGKVATRAN